MIWPRPDEPIRDHFLTNYIDLDPRENVLRDWNGGTATYDGHNAIDAGNPNFGKMDEGAPIIAAADGVVKFVQDIGFDRNTGTLDNIVPGGPPNVVRVDHGDGWETVYVHLRRDSIRVKVGQTVEAGDILGWEGSSGHSTGSHIHFELERKGLEYETFLDPDTFWIDPPPYTHDGDRSLLDLGVTNYNVLSPSHLKERPNEFRAFSQDAGQRVRVFGYYTSLNAADVLQAVFFEPGGAEFARSTINVPADFRNARYVHARDLPDMPAPGEWRVEIRINDELFGEDSFTVTENGGAALRVENPADGQIIRHRRFTPLDLGTIAKGSVSPVTKLNLINHGTVDLNVDDVVVPAGFTVVSAPAMVAPGASAEVKLELDSDVTGYRSGQLRILTNDPARPSYNVSLEGTVTDKGTLRLGLSDRVIDEGGEVVGTLRRIGADTTSDLIVTLSSNDPTEVALPATVTISAGEEYVNFLFDALFDQQEDSTETVTITATAEGFDDSENELDVENNEELDFGDAPDGGLGAGPGNYRTTLDDDGPRHRLINDIRLGSLVDPELDGLESANADGDDLDEVDDEDAVDAPVLGQFPELDVNVTNLTQSEATLYGWIDYNGNGQFETGERASAPVVTGLDNEAVTLQFRELTREDLKETVARFRVSTDSAARLPVGPASDGEVEDHLVSFDVNFLTLSVDPGTVSEADGLGAITATVEVDDAPATDLTVAISSSNTDAAIVPPTVTILAGETSATFDIDAVDDEFVDGTQSSLITVSADGHVTHETTVSVENDDVPGFSVTESGGDTTVSEDGTTDSFSVVLTARPLTDVVFQIVNLNSDDLATDTDSLTFTTDNWDTPQDVTVSAEDDEFVEGAESGTIRIRINASETDEFYRNLTFQIVDVEIEDDDVAGFAITESGGDTGVGESGSTDSFTVVLTGQPLSPVRLTVESADTDETTVDVSELIFTGENWDQPQTVTVTGVDDEINDGTQSVDVTLAIDPAGSNDLFDGVSSQTVSVAVDGLPSLDELADVTAAEDSANIMVDLTGISAGGSDVQPIRVTAAISNPSLATVSVAYADPAAIGELTIDPQLDATGEAIIEVTVEDGGLDANLSTTDDNQFFTRRFGFRLTPVNDEPVIAVPGAITVEEDERFSFEPAANGTFVVTDVDASTLRATVSVSNGVLIVPENVFGLSIDGTRTGDDSLTFLGSQVAINRALNRLVYEPNADFTGSDTLSLTVNDRGLSGSGGALEVSDTVGITVLNDDDPPRNEVPGAQTTAEDTTLVFGETRRIAVSDVDAPAGGLQVSLTATNGLLDLSTTSGLSFSAGGDGTAAMTFTGQIADINTALDDLEFSPTANFNGAAEILIETLDPVVGASSTDSDRVEITVSAVNDEPENSLPAGPVSIQEDTPLVFSGGNLISISDAGDGDQGNMQVALLVTGGLLELSGTSDLDFSIGSGRDQLMRFSGTVANVNAALDGLTFIPTRDFSGDVELRIVTSDLGNTGDGPELLDRDELTINVTAVDVAPTGQPDLYFVRAGETLSTSDALGTTTDTTRDNGVLANDSDPDTAQDQLTATIETAPASAASFSLETDGTFSYRTEMPVVEDSFAYRVTDGSTPSAPVTATIRVNHAPVVTASTFTLAEGSDAGTSAGQVQATDLNTSDLLRYEIVEGNTGGAFSLNIETGQLTVLNSSALNFETNPVFELTVRVTDNAPEFVRSSTEQTIRVELTDVSENLEIGEDDWESDGLTLLRDGDRIRIVRTGTDTDVASAEAGTIQAILVEGRIGIPDRLTVDFSGGNPIIGSLSFGGRDDTAYGGADKDTMFGGAGEDVLLGNGGVGQLLSGGPGNDVLVGGSSGDRVVETTRGDAILASDFIQTPETGRDILIGIELATIFGDASANRLDARAFSPVGLRGVALYGIDGDDHLQGSPGVDLLVGGRGRDLLQGFEGSDFLLGSSDPDRLEGGGGNDVLRGQGSNDVMLGGDGNDLMDGGGGIDSVLEFATPDGDLLATTTQLTGRGNDTLLDVQRLLLEAGDGDNLIDVSNFQVANSFVRINAAAGNDRIFGSPGRDLIFAGDGDDLVLAGDGNDVVYGGDGDDALAGGGDNDHLFGNGGRDTAVGGDGNDILQGGANPDILIGGAGIDRVDGDGATDLLAGGDGTGVDTGDNLVGEEAEIDETFDENLLAELMDEV